MFAVGYGLAYRIYVAHRALAVYANLCLAGRVQLAVTPRVTRLLTTMLAVLQRLTTRGAATRGHKFFLATLWETMPWDMTYFGAGVSTGEG